MSDLPDTENGDKGSYAAPALEKGLDILELLAEVGEPLSTREIAERLARSKSEIFRMVFVLQQRGYLAREAGTGRACRSTTRRPEQRRARPAYKTTWADRARGRCRPRG